MFVVERKNTMSELGNDNKIKWVEDRDSTFPIFCKNHNHVIYQLNENTLLKVFQPHVSQEQQQKLAIVTQYFLNHGFSKDFIPTCAWLSDQGFFGYEMKYDVNYRPLSQVLPRFDSTQIEEVLHVIEKELLEHTSEYIYTDIDVDNILYFDGKIKWIDFDDCLITNKLSEAERKMGINHQRSVFNLFSISLLYRVSLEDIYYLEQSQHLSDQQKEKIREMLSAHHLTLDSLLEHYHVLNRQK